MGRSRTNTRRNFGSRSQRRPSTVSITSREWEPSTRRLTQVSSHSKPHVYPSVDCVWCTVHVSWGGRQNRHLWTCRFQIAQLSMHYFRCGQFPWIIPGEMQFKFWLVHNRVMTYFRLIVPSTGAIWYCVDRYISTVCSRFFTHMRNLNLIYLYFRVILFRFYFNLICLLVNCLRMK